MSALACSQQLRAILAERATSRELWRTGADLSSSPSIEVSGRPRLPKPHDQSGKERFTRTSALYRTFILAAVMFVVSSASAQGTNVGFAKVQIPNGTEPPLTAGIWYPTDAEPSVHPIELFAQTVAVNTPVKGYSLPLVVISHGGGGSYASHYETALALAHAGFVAAAISHAGDTYDDQSKVLQLWRRPEQLRVLVSYMLRNWPPHERLDASRIGAFGFSNGGFTVLVAAGGIPDLKKIGPYCHAHTDHDLCQALKNAKIDPAHVGDDVPPNAWAADPRIKAVVAAAPAFAFTFTKSGLKNVHIPIQLWRAADDHHQPNPYYEEILRQRLPQPPEYHVIPDAGHYDFLPPCSASLAAANPLICADPSGFSRTTFHEEFNGDIVRFFRRTLKVSQK
jgi:predicted dienelactone hydrolase